MAEFKPQSVPDPLPQPGGKQPTSYDFPELHQQPESGGGFRQFFANNKWYILASVVGIVIISVLGYFAFHKQTPEPTKNADVTMVIDSADTAPSGGEVIYKIQIDNHDKAKLVDMNLELVYEDGIKYVSSTPPADNDTGTRFPVPDLASGQNVVLIIKTTASGNINEDKQIVARLRYKFDNFSSEFTQETSKSVRLVAADIVLDVTGPEKSTNVQTATYDIFYRNDSDKDINGARIQVTYPNEFKYGAADPSPSLGQNIWNINSLPKNGSGKISFNGNFKNVQAGQSVLFQIEFMALDDSNSFFTQASTSYMTTIEAQPLSVEQRTANEITNNIVKPGDSIEFELKYQNNTQVTATGVSIAVHVDSKAADLSTLKSDNGLVQDSTITWNAAGVPALESLKPNQSGTVRYSVQLKNPAVKDSSKSISVTSKAEIKSNENTSFLPGNDIVLKVSSPSSIETALVSTSGPLPIKVGQTSTMQVTVSLRNASNDYREGVLIGYVPLGVTFDKTSVSNNEAAAVKFDAATGKLTWTVGQLAAHSGSTNPLRTLKFNIKVTPSGNQTNQSIVLFKTISFAAKDTFTEQAISLNTRDIDTDSLPGSGDGRVQP